MVNYKVLRDRQEVAKRELGRGRLFVFPRKDVPGLLKFRNTTSKGFSTQAMDFTEMGRL